MLDRSGPKPDPIEGADFLPLGNGIFAIVDADLYRDLSKHTWALGKTGYVYNPSRTTRKIRLHQVITGWPFVDHRNRNKLDNRRQNLRPAGKSNNGCNRGKTSINKTGFKGVVRQGKRFVAYIGKKEEGDTGKKGKTHYLGSFDTAKEAAHAYDEAAKRLHGEFACPNFPEKQVLS